MLAAFICAISWGLGGDERAKILETYFAATQSILTTTNTTKLQNKTIKFLPCNKYRIL